MTDEPQDPTAITADERSEIDAAVEAGDILSDADLAEYVQSSTVAEIQANVGDDVLLTKRLLAAEQASDKPRKGLVASLTKSIGGADSASDDTAPEADDTDDPNTVKREQAGTWWCPLCDHSQMLPLMVCGGCGAVRDGDTVTAPESP